MCWDGSSKSGPLDWVINDDVDMEKEPPITFGTMKMTFMQQLYNLQISYPDTELLLAFTGTKACFRWPKINTKICGTFSYWMCCLSFYFVSTAMDFGFKSSANSWEPVPRAIETLTGVGVYFSQLSNDRTEMKSILTWFLSLHLHLQI